ncbi:MAG: hypothetical protein KJ626_14480 [Verrucomicrobia bacterium]|nr:hypothetical protein [Verrucomicrobiota bacterium]
MAKAFKVFVILLLLLSIASLVLGIMLFNQREVLKGRLLEHEKAVVQFAKGIRFKEMNDAQLQNMVETKVRVYEGMDSQLREIAVAADNQWVELQDTKADLERTRQELADTKEELRITKNELEAARNEIARLEGELAQCRADLAAARDQIDQLEQEKLALEGEIESLNTQIVEAEELIRDLEDEVASLKLALKEYEGDSPESIIEPGTSGSIVDVNESWNFVVLDIGSQEGLVPNAVMMVHRADHLVGKVKITAVQEKLAVADIMRDWQMEPIKEGDNVLF